MNMKTEDKAVFKKLGDIIKLSFSSAEQLIIDAYKSITTPLPVLAKEVKTADGLMTFSFEGEIPTVGIAVMDVTSGTPVPVADGEYVMEGGINVTISGGMFAEVETKEAAVEEAPADLTAVKKEFATQMSEHKVALTKQVSDQANEIKELKGLVVKMSSMITEILEAPIGGEIKKDVVNEDWMKLPYDKMTNAQKVKFNRM